MVTTEEIHAIDPGGVIEVVKGTLTETQGEEALMDLDGDLARTNGVAGVRRVRSGHEFRQHLGQMSLGGLYLQEDLRRHL